MGKLWDDLPSEVKHLAPASVNVFEGSNGKPILEVEIGGRVFYLTANLAEMIGSVAIGARLRYEDSIRYEDSK